MSRILRYMVLAVLGITLVGCGTAAKQIQMKSQGERMDVFSEVKDESAPPKGFVDLIIKASIKTHLESYYILESKESLHRKQGYPYVFNLDGQAVIWRVEGQKEVTPAYDENGKRIPEGGEGMRYILEKKIRLAAGAHKIFFGLPEEDYFEEIEITLKEGKLHALEFKPVYRKDNRRIQSFLHEIKSYEVFLDEKHLN